MIKRHLLLTTALFWAQQQGVPVDGQEYNSDESLVVRLTGDNFYEKTLHKRVFIDFYDPMWGHCLLMADDWSDFADEFEDDDDILIGKMDCTNAANKPICQDYGVKGYPTLMYGDVVDLQKYLGQRDLLDWRDVVHDNLRKPLCGVGRPDLCSESKRKDIDDLFGKGLSGIDSEIQQVEEKLKAVDQKQDDFVEALQKQYHEGLAKKETDKQKLKEESNLKLLNTILALKTKDS